MTSTTQQHVGPRISPPRRVLKVYRQVRTANLERVREGRHEVTVLYEHRRYDFDEQVAERLRVRRAGLWGTFLHAWREDLDIIETNEILSWGTAGRGLAAVLGNRLRSLRTGRPRATTTSYAIQNKDPRDVLPTFSRRTRVRLLASRPARALLWRLTDRVAFGTDQALHLYRELFPRTSRWPQFCVVPALPGRPLDLDASARAPHVVYLGDLSRRKGFDLLLSAWPRVSSSAPGARLTVLGKGALADLAVTFAAGEPRVQTLLDPPRDRIFAELRRAKVLVLPSQPAPHWREQVGLPIVEGLGSGCVIVTTDQTGLAPWLSRHGHVVIPSPTDPGELAAGMVAALEDPRDPGTLVRLLPQQDGRRAAEAWMYGDGSPVDSEDSRGR